MAEGKEQERQRLEAVVKRLVREVFWIRADTEALEDLEGLWSVGLDFFRVAHTAIVGDRFVRLLRLVDDHRDSNNVEYLRNCRRDLFDKHLDLVPIETMRDRLDRVRDQVVMHIDRRVVGNASRLYQEAGITGRELHEFVEWLWRGLLALHEAIVGVPFEYTEYDTGDAKRLAQLRDDARSRQG